MEALSVYGAPSGDRAGVARRRAKLQSLSTGEPVAIDGGWQWCSRDNADSADGSAASQIAIKQLGTNRGGFFNVNSAHPFEASPSSNWLEMLSILLIPAALCYTFGKMVKDTGRAGR